MASATLSVEATGSNNTLSLVVTDVVPANSVTVTGTGPGTQMSLTPQTPTDTTFTLTFVAGTNVSSVNSVTVPVPFGPNNLLTINPPGPVVVTAFDVAPFQGSNFSFTVTFTPTGTTKIVREDPTIVFNPPSTDEPDQLVEAPVAAEPVIV